MEPDTPEPMIRDKRTLLEVTALAAGIAGIVLLLFVLPAEHGIDPTRLGELMGIKGIAAPDGAGASIHAIESSAYRNDTATVTVPAGTGIEYKFHVAQGSGFVYTWQATGAMYFDFHGEPEGDKTYFESYQQATADRADGSFHAPFTGSHGWYWQNDGPHDVTVTLYTSGHYDILGIQ